MSQGSEQKKKRDVRLDRFVRVMSGGLFVTDDLVAVREGKIDEELESIENYLSRIEGYGAKTEAKELRDRRDQIQQQRAKAEKIKSNQDKSKALEQVKKNARDLFNEACSVTYQAKIASEEAERAKSLFRSLEDEERDQQKFDKSGKNPVTEILKGFSKELQSADTIVKCTDREKDYLRINDAMKLQREKCWECKAARLAAQRTIQSVTIRFDLLPEPVGFGAGGDKRKLKPKLASCTTDIGKAFAEASDLDAVKKSLEEVVKKAEAISVEVDEARAKLADLTTLKAEVEEKLQAIKAVITDIVDGNTGKGFESELEQLRGRQKGGDLLTDETESKKAFFALDKDAIKLLERARKAVFDEKAKTPEGRKEIDDLIDTFGDKTADLKQQAVCRAALAARFKLDLEIPEGLSVERLPLLFKLFGQVPAEHVGHDMLIRLELGTEPASNQNFYSSTNKKIVLEPKIDRDVDQDYVRQDGTGAKETLKYFSATTLHEIGHGVDAKFEVMQHNQKSAGCGQWQKESLDSVVNAYYEAHFQKYVGSTKQATESDLKEMLRQLLTAGRCAKPASTTDALGTLLADWDVISNEPAFTTYCAAIRVDSDPWQQRHTAGTRVYQESYSNDWWSYVADERQQSGISSYQWRAPFEWFAEVYALWHLKKKQGFPESIAQYVKGSSQS